MKTESLTNPIFLIMKKIFFLVLILITLTVQSQTIEIVYKQEQSYKGKKAKIDTADLKLCDGVSLYSIRKNSMSNSSTSETSFSIDLSDEIDFLSLLHTERMERWTKDYVFTKPYIVYENGKINWMITSEKKKIGPFSATKAQAAFKGRNYVAWFSDEIPVQSGPWKLAGLPGLILEAKDDLNEIHFQFVSVKSINKKSSLDIADRKTLPNISWDDFKLLYNQKLNSLKKMLFAKSGGAENETSVTIKPNVIEKSLF